MVRSKWRDARCVLCVRLDGLGDVLMMTPALHALRESAPDRKITLLTSPAGAEVARYCSAVDDVTVYEAPWMKATPARDVCTADFVLVRQLMARRFDAAIVFQTFSQSPLPAAMTCFLAGIPLRAAYCRENPYHLLTDWLAETEMTEAHRHEVRRQLDLVAALGADAADRPLVFDLPRHAERTACITRRHAGLVDVLPWAAIHPGATAPSRRYPAEMFASVVRQLVARGLQVALTGSDEERPLVAAIQRMADCHSVSLAGQLDLGELAATFRSARAVVSNNTGPMHVAAAVGTPVVALYALTNPQHTPWRVRNIVLSRDVPCRNCYRSVCLEEHHDCLRGVPP